MAEATTLPAWQARDALGWTVARRHAWPGATARGAVGAVPLAALSAAVHERHMSFVGRMLARAARHGDSAGPARPVVAVRRKRQAARMAADEEPGGFAESEFAGRDEAAVAQRPAQDGGRGPEAAPSEAGGGAEGGLHAGNEAGAGNDAGTRAGSATGVARAAIAAAAAAPPALATGAPGAALSPALPLARARGAHLARTAGTHLALTPAAALARTAGADLSPLPATPVPLARGAVVAGGGPGVGAATPTRAGRPASGVAGATSVIDVARRRAEVVNEPAADLPSPPETQPTPPWRVAGGAGGVAAGDARAGPAGDADPAAAGDAGPTAGSGAGSGAGPTAGPTAGLGAAHDAPPERAAEVEFEAAPAAMPEPASGGLHLVHRAADRAAAMDESTNPKANASSAAGTRVMASAATSATAFSSMPTATAPELRSASKASAMALPASAVGPQSALPVVRTTRASAIDAGPPAGGQAPMQPMRAPALPTIAATMLGEPAMTGSGRSRSHESAHPPGSPAAAMPAAAGQLPAAGAPAVSAPSGEPPLAPSASMPMAAGAAGWEVRAARAGESVPIRLQARRDSGMSADGGATPALEQHGIPLEGTDDPLRQAQAQNALPQVALRGFAALAANSRRSDGTLAPSRPGEALVAAAGFASASSPLRGEGMFSTAETARSVALRPSPVGRAPAVLGATALARASAVPTREPDAVVSTDDASAPVYAASAVAAAPSLPGALDEPTAPASSLDDDAASAKALPRVSLERAAAASPLPLFSPVVARVAAAPAGDFLGVVASPSAEAFRAAASRAGAVADSRTFASPAAPLPLARPLARASAAPAARLAAVASRMPVPAHLAAPSPALSRASFPLPVVSGGLLQTLRGRAEPPLEAVTSALPRDTQLHGVAPAPGDAADPSFPSSTEASVPACASAGGAGVDLDEVVERALQALMLHLEVERERRGFAKWH